MIIKYSGKYYQPWNENSSWVYLCKI